MFEKVNEIVRNVSNAFNCVIYYRYYQSYSKKASVKVELGAMYKVSL